MPERTGPDAQPRLLIKKYPNRRYYDATHSRHVTLENIYTYIREGYELQATDSRTGEDITAKVLAQIIIELDPPKLGVFPVSLLHGLLRSNERLVGDFIHKYFNQPLTAFMDSQRNVEQYFRQAMGLNPPPGVKEWAKMMWGPFGPGMWSGVGTGSPTVPEAEPQGKAEPQEPEDLRKVVEELRREVARLRHSKGPRRARKPPRRGPA